MTKHLSLLAALLLSAAGITAHGQSNTQRLKALEDHQLSTQASIDSLAGAVFSLGNSLESITDNMDEIVDKIDGLETQSDYGVYRHNDVLGIVRRYSEIVMGWVCLLIFAIFLPLLLVRLYREQAEEKKRRYDIVVDLMKSGVEITPELRGFITGDRETGRASVVGLRSQLGQNDLDYCVKRLVWGGLLAIFGLVLALMTNEVVLLIIFGCVGLFFIAQAAICYFRATGAPKDASSETKSDAGEA